MEAKLRTRQPTEQIPENSTSESQTTVAKHPNVLPLHVDSQKTHPLFIASNNTHEHMTQHIK